MKIPIQKPLLLACIALAPISLLTNCVESYDQGHSQHERVTTYRTGYEVRSLPSGYRTETVGGRRYYLHDGTYYQRHSGGYVVVDSPRSRRDDRPVRFDGPDSRYGSGNRYRSTDSRDSREMDRLPSGYREIEHRGTRYYQHNGVYYQRGGTGYVVVPQPY